MNAHVFSSRSRLPTTTALLIFAAVLLGGCTSEADTPVPLATAEVPSLLEINEAAARWQAGNNRNYFAAVEETTPDGTSSYRIVVADGEIRAAQQLDLVDGEWQPPVAIDPEAAENYTIDALFERIRRDAIGEGPAPVNMFVLFDSISGFPTLVDAGALPTYTGDGGLLLNRQFSYTLSVSINTLLEDNFSKDKVLLLTLQLSGGDRAHCSVLRIFADGSSIYLDDCRQTLLQLRPPEPSFARLVELAEGLAPVELETGGGRDYSRLNLNGSGAAPADPAATEELWELALSLNELLSAPIGAGVTLLRLQGGTVVGYDMRTNLEQPANFEFNPPLHGAITDPAGELLIFSDANGLKWINTISGETGTFIANPAGQWFVPITATSQGRIFLQRFSDGGETSDLGWVSLDQRSWQPIAITTACVSGISPNPDGDRLAVAARSGEGCEEAAGLWIFDLDGGSGERIAGEAQGADAVAWSPSGERIAVVLVNPDDAGSMLHLISPEGDALAPLSGNETGSVTGVVWDQAGERVYFGLNGAEGSADMLVELEVETAETLRNLPGSSLIPIAFDPGGNFLAIRADDEVLVWLLDFGQLVPVTRGAGAGAVIIGWIDSGAGN